MRDMKENRKTKTEDQDDNEILRKFFRLEVNLESLLKG